MFERFFRKAALDKIISKAAASLSEILEEELEKARLHNQTAGESNPPAKDKEIPNKPVFSNNQPVHIALNTPGTSVTVPTNPIIGGTTYTDEKGQTKYKGGKYNVMIWIRPGSLKNSKGDMRPVLTNSIVVVAEAGGMGDSENTKAYGNAAFVNNALAKIDSQMKARFGDVSLGKYGLAAFSGGAGAVRQILNETSNKKPDAVIVLDSIHNLGKEVNPKSIEPFVQYAKLAAENPNSAKLFLAYSRITPSRKTDKGYENYVSSRQSAEYIANQVGAKQTNVDKAYGNIKPYAVHSVGGVTLIDAYDPARAKDPTRKWDEAKKAYVSPLKGTLQEQHVEIANAAPDIVSELAIDWNA